MFPYELGVMGWWKDIKFMNLVSVVSHIYHMALVADLGERLDYVNVWAGSGRGRSRDGWVGRDMERCRVLRGRVRRHCGGEVPRVRETGGGSNNTLLL
uniref:Uncharacterized protein n=1 Tax=Picea glauca TaxID=3330 RepID=A0A101LXX4_PICGL|nr:hypothetical protein ABT39_MTgene5540 [Picea glauca]